MMNDRAPINLAELERLAIRQEEWDKSHKKTRLRDDYRLAVSPEVVLRLVAALRDAHRQIQERHYPQGNNWQVDHGITDEATP